QVALVTRLPLQLWPSSWASKLVNERSPAMIPGVKKVKFGFSIPPYGKLGGNTKTSYRPQPYGPKSFSEASIIFSSSPNSHAALSNSDGSAYTPVRGPIFLKPMSPTAIASKYDDMGLDCLKV